MSRRVKSKGKLQRAKEILSAVDAGVDTYKTVRGAVGGEVAGAADAATMGKVLVASVAAAAWEKFAALQDVINPAWDDLAAKAKQAATATVEEDVEDAGDGDDEEDDEGDDGADSDGLVEPDPEPEERAQMRDSPQPLQPRVITMRSFRCDWCGAMTIMDGYPSSPLCDCGGILREIR